MTPAETAKDLVDKYWIYLRANLLYDDEAKEDAKHCAIIAVDEIMEFMKMDDEYTETSSNANSKWVYYWKQVKEEIQKL
jgi:hypothetical protein